MTNSNMGDDTAPAGNEEVNGAYRRAKAGAWAVEMLRELFVEDDPMFDELNVAESIQEIATALGWNHEGLPNYMLGLRVGSGDDKAVVRGLADGYVAWLSAHDGEGGMVSGWVNLDDLSLMVIEAISRRAAAPTAQAEAA